MKPDHIHLNVSKLRSTLDWFAAVLELSPEYEDERMAVIPFGAVVLILDEAEEDSPATIGFASEDCDADYQRLLDRGAEPLREPTDQSWGPVRSAYFKGPGSLVVELEQAR